jgi:hypothetical protein
MSSGKAVTRSKKKAVMIYLDPVEAAVLTDYAAEEGMSASGIVREGLQLRMRDKRDPYITGFNEGLNAAIEVVQTSKGGQMMFPSGKSFAQIVCDDIEKKTKRRRP